MCIWTKPRSQELRVFRSLQHCPVYRVCSFLKKNHFHHFFRAQIDFSRTLKFTLTLHSQDTLLSISQSLASRQIIKNNQISLLPTSAVSNFFMLSVSFCFRLSESFNSTIQTKKLKIQTCILNPALVLNLPFVALLIPTKKEPRYDNKE